MILLPASPDGRDLAPRLAVILGLPLLAGAVRCAPGEVEVTRLDDRLSVRVGVDGPVLVTLRPGLRGTLEPVNVGQVSVLSLAAPTDRRDAESSRCCSPSPEWWTWPRPAGSWVAARAGAGWRRRGGRDAAAGEVGAALGASAGATRVVTDAGWMSYDRQIGTTGVSVNPELYIAFGISGAAQHVGGLGAPEHLVSVNTDPSCPMTAMADLGIVADAPAVLAELAKRLGVTAAPGGSAEAGRPRGEGASHAG